MCSTCNYTYAHTEYKRVIVKAGKNEEERFEQSLGMGNLVIRCDTDGKNYKLFVKDDPNSGFTIYRCPTCGKKLY